MPLVHRRWATTSSSHTIRTQIRFRNQAVCLATMLLRRRSFETSTWWRKRRRELRWHVSCAILETSRYNFCSPKGQASLKLETTAHNHGYTAEFGNQASGRDATTLMLDRTAPCEEARCKVSLFEIPTTTSSDYTALRWRLGELKEDIYFRLGDFCTLDCVLYRSAQSFGSIRFASHLTLAYLEHSVVGGRKFVVCATAMSLDSQLYLL